ncbi:MAG: glycosyltransferase [Firmicutes bacterium]|nr:glycosyltransferase [Alicyclobacillaceae bacterium]MCL6497568.1 glycosyltransferase [Bacillota bacterium]
MIECWTASSAGPFERGLGAILHDALTQRGVTVQWRPRPPRWPRLGPGPTLVFGFEAGLRAKRALAAWPDVARAQAWLAENPERELWVVFPAVAEALAAANGPLGARVRLLPALIPDPYFLPGDPARVFTVTGTFHLEERPRWVASLPLDDGAALTRLLELGHRHLKSGGELLLLDGLAIRPRLAPVLERMRLAERVVFLPDLDHATAAAIFHSADLFLAPAKAEPGFALLAALAAGLPVVAHDDARVRIATGGAAILVQRSDISAWSAALDAATQWARTREALIRRGLAVTAAWRLSEALPAWLQAFEGVVA